tara:strand:- start:1821 stop:2483 length:663 start_codon:yes stop_codon:yes gene_type:complete
MTGMLPVLYSFRRCPYAMRARLAIAASGQTCALREVVLRNKPAEMLEASPKATVPVLVFPDGQVIEESDEIMEWALGVSDPDGWLFPALGTADEMKALIAANDGNFKHHLDRYKYPGRYENVDPLHHRSEGVAFLELLEARLSPAGFLFGDRFSMADAAIAPFVRQFAHVDKDWFDELDLPKVRNWLQGVLDSAIFATVMQKYPAWQTGDEEPLFPDVAN